MQVDNVAIDMGLSRADVLIPEVVVKVDAVVVPEASAVRPVCVPLAEGGGHAGGLPPAKAAKLQEKEAAKQAKLQEKEAAKQAKLQEKEAAKAAAKQAKAAAKAQAKEEARVAAAAARAEKKAARAAKKTPSARKTTAALPEKSVPAASPEPAAPKSADPEQPAARPVPAPSPEAEGGGHAGGEAPCEEVEVEVEEIEWRGRSYLVDADGVVYDDGHAEVGRYENGQVVLA